MLFSKNIPKIIFVLWRNLVYLLTQLYGTNIINLRYDINVSKNLIVLYFALLKYLLPSLYNIFLVYIVYYFIFNLLTDALICYFRNEG